jgi:hypothetical protein
LFLNEFSYLRTLQNETVEKDRGGMAAAIPSGYADGINRRLMGAYAEPAETAKLTAELKDCNNSTSEKSV